MDCFVVLQLEASKKKNNQGQEEQMLG